MYAALAIPIENHDPEIYLWFSSVFVSLWFSVPNFVCDGTHWCLSDPNFACGGRAIHRNGVRILASVTWVV